ncbi:MAG: hypothetical protein JWM11_6049, partial [Planctomycetaceae bacterium]|nr:hypothetical protein [Planctomycetaceae bacterium]
MSDASQSIHALEPLEIGGTVARIGLDVQDHVAAGFCLDMVTEERLGQIWTETQDDVFLLWINDGVEEVEFVQVKSNELDQLWSIAELLKKEPVAEDDHGAGGDGKPNKSKKKEGRCILEKSLQYDRCSESVRFRIVTCRPV